MFALPAEPIFATPPRPSPSPGPTPWSARHPSATAHRRAPWRTFRPPRRPGRSAARADGGWAETAWRNLRFEGLRVLNFWDDAGFGAVILNFGTSGVSSCFFRHWFLFAKCWDVSLSGSTKVYQHVMKMPGSWYFHVLSESGKWTKNKCVECIINQLNAPWPDLLKSTAMLVISKSTSAAFIIGTQLSSRKGSSMESWMGSQRWYWLKTGTGRPTSALIPAAFRMASGSLAPQCRRRTWKYGICCWCASWRTRRTIPGERSASEWRNLSRPRRKTNHSKPAERASARQWFTCCVSKQILLRSLRQKSWLRPWTRTPIRWEKLLM